MSLEGTAHIILLKFEKCRGVYLSGYSSAMRLHDQGASRFYSWLQQAHLTWSFRVFQGSKDNYF